MNSKLKRMEKATVFNGAQKTKSRADKIRERHRGISTDDVEFIAGKEKVKFHDDTSPKNVVIYIRVSTDNEMQIGSFELQRKYYEDYVKDRPYWTLVRIYADEGKSGTTTEKRDDFNRMIEDCKNPQNKIDLIVVKTVSRFARSIVDCLKITQELAYQRPPVGVFFEMENIFSLNEMSEMMLQQYASMAEYESKQKSTLLKDAYVKRSRYGIVWTPELLGYDLDDDGNLTINEEEAKTVRLIFFMYLFGHTCEHIANRLMELGLRTNGRNPETGEYNMKWSPGTVLQILQNERHCGELLSQKTWTPNFRSHKSIKNRKDLPQYRKRNHHEPIISREDYIAVQRLIANAKYGNKGFLPQLKVITEGALQGFVSLNPRWAAFTAKDYISASASAYGEALPKEKDIEIEAKAGDIDLRGYEVVRVQFFNTTKRKSITFSTESMWFGAECIRKLWNALYVEVLINPTDKLIAVRPCAKDNRNAIRWAVIEGDKYMPRNIPGAAFLKTLYEIFGWNADYRYRVRGIKRQKNNEAVLVFDMRETEVFIPKDVIAADTNTARPVVAARNTVTAYPQNWMYDFGTEHYRLLQAQEILALESGGLDAEGELVQDDLSSKVTGPDVLKKSIKKIIKEIEGGTVDGNK